MSVIAWDGQNLASDSAATYPDGHQNRVVKVAALDVRRDVPLLGRLSVVLFGVAGAPERLIRLSRFLAGEADTFSLKDDAVALIASPEGAWLWQGNGPVPLVNGAKAALGNGSQAALGAMMVGASAIEAVKAACMVVDCCCEPIQVFSLAAPEPESTEPPELHEAQDRLPASDNGGSDAAQEGLQPEKRQQQHQDGNGARKAAKASGRNRSQRRPKGQA